MKQIKIKCKCKLCKHINFLMNKKMFVLINLASYPEYRLLANFCPLGLSSLVGLVEADVHPVCHVCPAPGRQLPRPRLAVLLHPLGLVPVLGGEGAPPVRQRH